MKNKRRAPKKTKTYAQLKKELDRVFSIWVRKSAQKDDWGLSRCVTCGTYAAWPKLQAGHWIPRHRLSTRWEKSNVHPQCYRCNVALRGNYTEYALFMIRTYGEAHMRDLDRRSKQPTKLTRADLQALIVRYSDPIQTSTALASVPRIPEAEHQD